MPVLTISEIKAQETRAAKMIREVFESGRPLTYIRSSEEQRVAGILREVGSRLAVQADIPVWTWSSTEGMRRNGDAEPGTLTARGALDFVAAYGQPAIFHLKDFHEHLRESAEVRRRLRDVHDHCLDRQKFVVITSPVRFIPEELERSIILIELRPPDSIELAEFLRVEAKQLGQDGQLSDAVVFQLARALQGLTIEEARYGVRRALASTGSLGPESIPALLEEKRLLVNRTGVIEFVDKTVDMEEIGGLETLKQWLLERRKLFRMGDNLSAEIVPKGMLVMGIPGCGKSLTVKAIASYFGLPLYRVDMVEIFSGRHGKPEVAFVDACRMLEDLAPAVLWFDEIEMAVTATEAGGEQGRIFAFFLTWMQEKSRGLFVAATANRIDLLPAEMIRKGRFDEVFFVDLPLEDERIDIFKIHLNSRGVNLERFNLDQLRSMTVGWTGAEIEQCVVSMLTKAKLTDREATEQDLIKIAASIVPLSRTMKEQIDHIRNWAFQRAVKASVGR